MSSIWKLTDQRAAVIEGYHEEIHTLLHAPKFWSGSGRHINYTSPRDNPFTKNAVLIHQSLSSNIILKSQIQGISVVVKQMALTPQLPQKSFLESVKKLSAVEHRHLITYLGTFNDREKTHGLIMYPVATVDLSTFLELLDETRSSQELEPTELITIMTSLGISRDPRGEQNQTSLQSWLQKLYGCLASALGYIHEQEVVHGEIKPGHILLSPQGPYLIDFGLPKSSSFSDVIADPAYRYCAPETLSNIQIKDNNKKSDIFSMGCCFLEISNVAREHALTDLRKTSETQSWVKSTPPAYKNNLPALNDWLDTLKRDSSLTSMTDEHDELDILRLMIHEGPSTRPNASTIKLYFDYLEGSTSLSRDGLKYHGACCRPVRFERNEIMELKKTLESVVTAQNPQLQEPAIQQPPADIEPDFRQVFKASIRN